MSGATERCCECGGQGEHPGGWCPILGDGPKHYVPPKPCKLCGGSGEVPSGTDPLSRPTLHPEPAVPESQEVLRQVLQDEVDRLEALSVSPATDEGERR